MLSDSLHDHTGVQSVIPRIVHLIWFGKIPSVLAVDAVEHWQRMGNGRKVILHNDDSLLLPSWRGIWERHAKTPHMQSDLLRWSLLLTQGGWYFDCDVRSNMTLDEVEQDVNLDGSKTFITRYGQYSSLRSDVLAMGLHWPGEATICEYVVSQKQRGSPLSYLAFAEEMLNYVYDINSDWFISGDPHRYSTLKSQVEHRVFRRNGLSHTEMIEREPLRGQQAIRRLDVVAGNVALAKAGAEKLGVSTADVAHYANALARWTAAGFPVREQAEVERIERDLCRPCEKYVDGRCKQCRCRVTTSNLAVANKIKMATEDCPLGKW